MAVPELDPAQRRAALAKAGESRRIRAELKQMLKAGEVGLPEVIERAETAEPLGRMRVVELLEAMPAVGKVKAAKVMSELHISPSRRVQGLGPRQREGLLARFDRR